MYRGFVIDSLTGSIVKKTNYYDTYMDAHEHAEKLAKSCGNIDRYSIDVR